MKKPLKMQGRREIKKEQSRQAIIAAAQKCFEKHGIKKTSIMDITTKANLAVGTFYNYFESKEALLLSFASGLVETIHDSAKKEIKKGKPAKELLRDITNMTIKELGKQMFLIPFLIGGEKQQNRERVPFWSPLTEKFCATYADVIKYGQKRDEFRKDVSAVIASEMLYAIFQSAVNAKVSHVSIADNIRIKLKIFVAGMEKK